MMDPKVVEALEGIYKGAERLRMIITEMLDVSQIDAKGLRLTFTPTNIGDLVEEVIKELSTFIKQRNQEVSLDGFVNLPQVAIDRKRMRQVLVNIIGNAIKFTPDGGKITVSFKRFNGDRVQAKGPASYLDIVIKDSGIGLDKEELDRIFEKFYEVGEIDKHSTSKYAYLGRGVGLGLPIARGIVEAHGGTLWAESSGYDAVNCPGSSFHIVLPVSVQTGELATMGLVAETAEERPMRHAEKDKPRAAEAAPAPPEAAPAKKPKVLLIEDDVDILNLTSRLLQHDYEILKAEGGKDGIELARETLPDLILLDVYMEDMTGYDVCEILKSDQKTKDIPDRHVHRRRAALGSGQGLQVRRGRLHHEAVQARRVTGKDKRTGAMPPLNLLLAFLLDLLLGDPRGLPHPVIIIGNFAARLERALNRPGAGKIYLLTAGLAAAAFVVALHLCRNVLPRGSRVQASGEAGRRRRWK